MVQYKSQNTKDLEKKPTTHGLTSPDIVSLNRELLSYDYALSQFLNEAADKLCLLEDLFALIDENLSTDEIFILQCESENSTFVEDEHYFYQWDEGKIITGVFLDKPNKTIYASSFEIIECWHRKELTVKANSTLMISKYDDLQFIRYPDWVEIELSGESFEPSQEIDQQYVPIEESQYLNYWNGLKVMNETAFNWRVNAHCRV